MIKIDQSPITDKYRLYIDGRFIDICADDAQLLLDAFARKSELTALREASTQLLYQLSIDGDVQSAAAELAARLGE